VIASLAALAAVGAWRHTGRRRRAAGARRPAATAPTREDGPMIGYVPMTPGATSADHDRSSATIVTACQDAGWDLLEIVCDNADGRPLERPGLTHALARIADGEADGLVVSDLRGVSRSIRDGATLVALDLALDTSTPGGRQAAATLVMVGSPDRDGDGGATDNGHREMRGGGRPAVRDRPELLERIASMRESGMTLREIADQLNAERVPTLRGGSQWRPSSIQVALGYRRPGPRDRLPSVPSRG
jgi:DNA invertase Pin-like site-specific DNA recombinase